MIVRINIRQPYLRQQLNVEFLIASLAETFPFTSCLFSDIIALFLSNQDSLKIPPWENKKACKSFSYGEKVLKSNRIRKNTVGAPASSSGASFFAWQRRARNASDWWWTARDHGKGTDTFPPSFARTSKERRLGTRQVGALLTHYGYNDATNNHNSALQHISEENGRQTTYEKVLELFTSLGTFKE